ncbi:PREDICTED: cell division cycle protein 123 homolog [Polistes dominula]|uniref:Cell division cycle protein 123 homolog n=1 Tax=Polistes dominula TaxID=743375 RepID=A0ABM1J5E2_POLDO|nr:PREDICTED: cell division cycle protein 123 homolog [Polistes dominula]
MINNFQPEFSFCSWYNQFKKCSLVATVIPISDDVLKYLQYDPFVLPLEAIIHSSSDNEWNDSSLQNDEDSEYLPSFPKFSKSIQDVIDEYGSVFIKSNWSSPLDATWMAPTKSLQCKTLEEVYLLLKSSDRIANNLSILKRWSDREDYPKPCLVLKQWRDINPCAEYRCFVIDDELVGISQRNLSQYYTYNESEKYNIKADIVKLFTEQIKGKFSLISYSFDVIRNESKNIKIIDFGPVNKSTTEGTLFTYEELQNYISDTPEFRFIAQNIGIQPTHTKHFCAPQEINEYFQTFNDEFNLTSAIQKEIEKQNQEQEQDEMIDS